MTTRAPRTHRRQRTSPAARRAGSLAAISLLAIAALTQPVVAAVRVDRAAPKEANGTSATTIPASKQSVRLTKIATAEQPLAVVQRSGDDTLYVVSKPGRISAVRNGVVDPYPLLDISARIDSENERGLLGLAFPPSRRDVAYIDYTTKQGNVIVAEVPFDGKTFDIAKQRVLLDVAKPFNEHNAGTLVFDDAGMLLVAIGDGGGSGDKFNNGQRRDVLLGKVLRIDPKPSATLPYGVPADNPFAKQPAGSKTRPEILAYGLRNPWRISIDAPTGDVWVPDVGQNRVEEINRLPKAAWGANFGWRFREGDQPFLGKAPSGLTSPVYAYPHLDGRCAVAGGFVYRGTSLVQLAGAYVFGDVCSGRLMALRNTGTASAPVWRPEDLGVRVPYLTAFGLLDSGELVAISLEGGIYRLDAGA